MVFIWNHHFVVLPVLTQETMTLVPEYEITRLGKPAVCTTLIRLQKPPLTEYPPPDMAALASGC